MTGVSVAVGVVLVVTCDCTNICVLAGDGSSGSSAGHGPAGIQTDLRTAYRHALVVRDRDVGQSLVAGVLNFIGPRNRIAHGNGRSRSIIGILAIGELLNAYVRRYNEEPSNEISHVI